MGQSSTLQHLRDGSSPSRTSTSDVALKLNAAALKLEVKLKELQAAAKRLGGGIGLKHLGLQGFQPIRNLHHPDLEFFQGRPS